MWQKLWESGKSPPKAFYERPEIEEHLSLYWVAFIELGTERQIGMSLGPIPRSKIVEYAREELGMIDQALDVFVEIIRGTDLAYLDIIHRDSKKDGKPLSEVSVTDTEGVKAMLNRVSMKKRKQKTK